MRPQSRYFRLAPLGLASLMLWFAPGCEEPRHVNKKLTGGAQTAAPAPAAAPESAPAEVMQPREVVGKRTQEIRNADTELQNGAQVATTKITAKDPITLQGNAYVTTVGRLAIMQIEQAVNLYKATNDRYPKDFAEFKAEIIQANNLALPQLPYYQEYGYDEKEHKLVVLEYPDRKAALKKQRDKEYGR